MSGKNSSSNRANNEKNAHPSPTGTNYHRLARAGICVVSLGVIVAAGVIFFSHRPENQAMAILDNCDDPLPEGGPARPWETNIQVSTYSSINTRTRNLFTAIPIVNWSGKGPAMNMMLYHNAAHVNSTFDLNSNVGFDLGPGWTISYSDQIVLDPLDPDNAYHIHSDGTVDQYAKSINGNWNAKRGNYNKLVQDSIDPNIYRVLHKDQTFHEFYNLNGLIRLRKVVDAVGNEVTLNYNVTLNRLQKITDASGRMIDLIYDETTGKLVSLVDPDELGGGHCGVQEITWNFTYTTGRLSQIAYPMNVYIFFEYDLDGRLDSTTDKIKSCDETCEKYYFDYFSDGGIQYVTDPDDTGDPNDGLIQEFDVICGNHKIYFKYFDRSGELWAYYYNYIQISYDHYPQGNLDGIDPPDSTIGSELIRDFDGNVTEYSNPGLVFTATYDNNGNMLTRTDALGHVQQWTYDQFNNVTSYTDAVGNLVEYVYEFSVSLDPGICAIGNPCRTCTGGSNSGSECDEDADCGGGTCDLDDSQCSKICNSDSSNFGDPCNTDNDCTCNPENNCPAGVCDGTCYPFPLPPIAPTQLTQIIEPGAAIGEDQGITEMVYNVDGQIIKVTDPNFVETNFNYDQWGQLNYYAEGYVDDDIYWQSFVGNSTPGTDSRGKVLESSTSYTGTGGSGTSGGRVCYYSGTTGGGGGVASGSSGGSGKASSSSGCDPAAAGSTASISSSHPTLPSNAPSPPIIIAHFNNVLYSASDELLEMPLSSCKNDCENDVPDYSRTLRYEYDNRGRVTLSEVESNESGPTPITRTFTYSYNEKFDISGGGVTRPVMDRTGPDGVNTYVQFDRRGKVEYVRRGPQATPIMEATYEYRLDDLVSRVIYGDPGLPNSQVAYTYDAAKRLISIDHQDGSGFNTQFKMVYSYFDNDLPSLIEEYNSDGLKTSSTSFTYDARNRLTTEVRMFSSPYDLEYKYDQGGNRIEKIDSLNQTRVEYTYDYQDPATHLSNNNRLMLEEQYNVAFPFNLLSTKWYYYNNAGNVTRIVTKDETLSGGGGPGGGGGTSSMSISGGGIEAFGGGGGGNICTINNKEKYTATRFEYAVNGKAVTSVIGEWWCWDENPLNNPTYYTMTYAREFRYDGGRQRYLDRKYDPALLQSLIFGNPTDTWSDYDGDDVYGDYTVSGGTLTNVRSFEPGTGRVTGGALEYTHSDMIGTLRTTSDSLGTYTANRVYTAFGEEITNNTDRYGYVGDWGYQSHDEFNYQHVGARYYDPSSGRFLQRDPLGIEGGLNVYEYVFNRPTIGIDPTGNGIWSWIGGAIIGVGGGIALVGGGSKIVGAIIIAVGAAIILYDTFSSFWALPKTATEKFEKVHKDRFKDFPDMIPCG